MREAALTLAALSYAEALARGRVDPKRLRRDYDIARPNVDAAAGLSQAVQQGDVGEWLAGLAPQDEEYRRLSETYVAAVRQARAERATPVPEGPAIRPGRSDRRLPAIAQALRARGYLQAEPAAQQQAPQQQQRPPARSGRGATRRKWWRRCAACRRITVSRRTA